MQLKDHFYTIMQKGGEDACPSYDIRLNASHFIYQAHFPGEPITPGVCLLQIARELLEEHLQRSLEVKAVKNMKFLAVVSPVATPDVTCRFDKLDLGTDAIRAQATVLSPDREFVKLSFTLSTQGV